MSIQVEDNRSARRQARMSDLWAAPYRRAIHAREVVERYLDGWLEGRTLVILRGVPGSGKSTLAWSIESACRSVGASCQVCSADDLFTDELNNYSWKRNEVYMAHRYCEAACNRALRTLVRVVVIDNTNLDFHDYGRYEQKALRCGYNVVVIEFMLRSAGDAIHALYRSSVEDKDGYRLERRLAGYEPDLVNPTIAVLVDLNVPGRADDA